jgi:hypothetical protein
MGKKSKIDGRGFFLFIIKSMVIRQFFFSQAHTTICMMPRHSPSSMMNFRCEKDEMGEKWFGKVAGSDFEWS